jgi:hypothetical protein
MGTKPSVFIGSSSEGLRVAKELQGLLNENADAILWTHGVFAPGKTYIESLIEASEKVDFAVLVMTADDVTVSRTKKALTPRDNVLYELGLFTGRLDRERCYFLAESTVKLKLPSDLSGVTAATYRRRSSGSLRTALAPACAQICEQISKLGRRFRIEKSELAAHQELSGFCAGITGCWWERVKPAGTTAISFVTIEHDAQTGTVKLKGRGYGSDGALVAPWASVATCVNRDDNKVFYYWRGSVLDRPTEPYEGFGEVSFRGPAGSFDSGEGMFSDTNLTDLKRTTKKSSTLQRCTPQEVAVMEAGGERVAVLIRKKLSERA